MRHVSSSQAHAVVSKHHHRLLLGAVVVIDTDDRSGALLDLAASAATSGNHDTLLLVSGASVGKVVRHIYARTAAVPVDRLTDLSLEAGDWPRLSRAGRLLQHAPLLVAATSRSDPSWLMAAVHEASRQSRQRVVVLVRWASAMPAVEGAGLRRLVAEIPRALVAV